VSEREVDWAATDRVVATVALDRETACSDTAKAVTRAVRPTDLTVLTNRGER
jgi:hypothetical protein